MFARSVNRRGFTEPQLEAVADSVCGCDLSRFFTEHVRGAIPVHINEYVERFGVRMIVDTIAAVDGAGRPLPDMRAWAYPMPSSGKLQLYPVDPSSLWSAATGGDIVSINGIAIATLADFVRARATVQVGDRFAVEISRGGRIERIMPTMTGYRQPRVRFVDVANVTAAQRAARARWESGGDAAR
jgi:predicted metalloprotease with PDZ domain